MKESFSTASVVIFRFLAKSMNNKIMSVHPKAFYLAVFVVCLGLSFLISPTLDLISLFIGYFSRLYPGTSHRVCHVEEDQPYG